MLIRVKLAWVQMGYTEAPTGQAYEKTLIILVNCWAIQFIVS